jgi:hypothetical protein
MFNWKTPGERSRADTAWIDQMKTITAMQGATNLI